MRVTVVGSGHGGCAMAAVLSMRGHQVSVLKLGNDVHAENFEILARRKTIVLQGIEGQGEFPLEGISRDPAEVIPEAEVVLIFYVCNYHQVVAEKCGSYFRSSQVVVLNPGYCGSLLFYYMIKNTCTHEPPVFVECETLPYSSRLTGNGVVSIVSRNVRHPYAALPSSRCVEVAGKLVPLLGECPAKKNVLEVALHNPNLVIHTVGVLLNAGLIENPRWRFAMYRDGFSPSVWNVVQSLDEEKMQVLRGLGLPATSYFDEFKLRTFEDTSIDGHVGFRQYASEAPDGPFALRHRYVTEDVPVGLGLLHCLGRELGIGTPVCDSLIHLASSLLGQDFWAQCRDISTMCGCSFQDVLALITS